MSRAWRRTAGWLTDILKTKKWDKAVAARWKVLYFKHPQPDPCQATPEQLHSMQLFDAWRSTVVEGYTHSAPWLKAFASLATQQAEKEEQAARTAATVKFANWLKEGAAGGLRRQHRYSRNTGGVDQVGFSQY